MPRNDLPRLSRREMLKLSAAGGGAFSISGWVDTFAADAAKHPQRKKAVILLWMNGGALATDRFGLEPQHRTRRSDEDGHNPAARGQDSDDTVLASNGVR